MNNTRIFSVFLIIMVFFVSCREDKKDSDDVRMSSFLDELMDKMTLEEKIGQLNLLTGGYIVTGEASNSDIGKKIKEGSVGGVFNVRSGASPASPPVRPLPTASAGTSPRCLTSPATRAGAA